LDTTIKIKKKNKFKKRFIDVYNNWAKEYLNSNEIVVYQNCENDPIIIDVLNQIAIYTWDETYYDKKDYINYSDFIDNFLETL